MKCVFASCSHVCGQVCGEQDLSRFQLGRAFAKVFALSERWIESPALSLRSCLTRRVFEEQGMKLAVCDARDYWTDSNPISDMVLALRVGLR